MCTMHVACHRCCQGAPREGTPCELPRRGPHGALTGRWRGAARPLLRYKTILPLRILGTVWNCIIVIIVIIADYCWRLLQWDYWRLLETYEYHMRHKNQQNISTLFLSCSTKHKHLSQVKPDHNRDRKILEHLSVCRVCRVCRVCHAFSFS